MDAVQRERQRRHRQQHAGGDRRHAERRDRAEAERVEREEGGARGRERAEVGAVAVVGDHQVPGRVPARGRRREQTAERAEPARHAAGVERVAHRAEAERQHRPHPGEPHEQARGPQRAPDRADRERPAGVDSHRARGAGGSRRGQRRIARRVGARGREGGRQLAGHRRERRAHGLDHGVGGVGGHIVGATGPRGCTRGRRQRKWQEITIRAVISAGVCPAKLASAGAATTARVPRGSCPDRRRRARDDARARRDRGRRLRPARRRHGARARLAAPDPLRRLLAGVRRGRHAARVHPVRRPAQPRRLE